ncbi:MAG: hypothetical protein ACJ0RK_04790 [Alphaproteobacteria bacterium]|tara:strand:+ start:325 stop:510 length:186 start_codon:yes stop_codon:yes gene_type:complete
MLLLAEFVFTFIAFFLGVMIIHLIAKSILKLDNFIQRNKILYWSGLIIGVLIGGSIYISIS